MTLKVRGGSWTGGAGGTGAKSSQDSLGARERFKQGGWCWRWPTLAWARPRLPSALVGLTAGFGMGPGVPPPLLSPTSTPHCRVVERSPGRLGCASLALPACLHPCGRVLARSELNRMSSPCRLAAWRPAVCPLQSHAPVCHSHAHSRTSHTLVSHSQQ